LGKGDFRAEIGRQQSCYGGSMGGNREHEQGERGKTSDAGANRHDGRRQLLISISHEIGPAVEREI
jgi:hypothetical protein